MTKKKGRFNPSMQIDDEKKGSIQSVNAKVHLSFKRAIAFLFFFEFPNSFLSTPYVSLTKPLVVITNPLCYCTNTPLCRQEIIDPLCATPSVIEIGQFYKPKF